MVMERQVVKVRREKLEVCMTCPLCNKLLRDATTISECLHTSLHRGLLSNGKNITVNCSKFQRHRYSPVCRNCIYEKITEEEFESCPVCNIDLGCAPLEKLRADHNLQDIRSKIFPFEIPKAEAPEAVPAVPLPARRKERSLSSLEVSAPRVSAQSGLTGRRMKFLARKIPAPREPTLSIEEPVKKVEDYPENLNPPETPRKIPPNKWQNSSIVESSKRQMANKGTEDNPEPRERKPDFWKSLNSLAGTASTTKTSKFNLQGAVFKSELRDAHYNEALVPKSKLRGRGIKPKVHGDANDSTPAPSGSVKPRNLHGIRQKKAAATEGLNIPAQAVVDANTKYRERFSPIWFSLVASDDQEGDEPLPQISSCYLRVKDGSLPVSFINKYIVRKLDLASEAEVEISLRGRPVIPSLQLCHLVDLWLQTAPTSERIQTSVGSSAKDFLLVLSYGRKAQPP